MSERERERERGIAREVFFSGPIVEKHNKICCGNKTNFYLDWSIAQNFYTIYDIKNKIFIFPFTI